MTDDRSTPLEQSDDDDYDVGLEEPVIEGSRPTSLQEFAEDARTPGAGEPRVVGPEPGSVTFPSAARLIE